MWFLPAALAAMLLALAMLALLVKWAKVARWCVAAGKTMGYNAYNMIGKHDKAYQILGANAEWHTKSIQRVYEDPVTHDKWRLEEFYSCLIRKRT